MLNQPTSARVLQSSLLQRKGFRHGFSLRVGGVSQVPFDSLNLGRAVGDEPEAVEENVQRFRCDVGIDADRMYELSQVHGTIVHIADGSIEPKVFRARQGDALVSATPGVAVGARTADCVPVLIGDLHTGAVAAVHAGWRGVLAGVIHTTTHVLQRLTGTEPATWCAAIGPHIRKCCFEVGNDVAGDFERLSTSADLVDHGFERPHVSLVEFVKAQLAQDGVQAPNIDDVGGCTYCDPARFFSYRRDGARSGRHLAVIVSR